MSSLIKATVALFILSVSCFSYAADSQGKVIIVPLSGFDSTAAATPVGGNFKTTVGEQRLEVFEHAAFLWSTILDLDYDVKVEVQFNALDCSSGSATLGYAGPNRVKKIDNVWYSTAQANQILKTDTSGSYNDIYAEFNSSIDNGCYNGAPNGWYYGLDNNPTAGKEGLLDVVLHEIAHGLGFLTFVDGGTGKLFSTGDGSNAAIDAYSQHLYDYSRNKLWTQMSNAERLASNNDDALVWSGEHGNTDAANKSYSTGIINGDIKIHAPSSYASGSSISHISTVFSPNQLMEPYNTVDGVLPDLEITMFKDIGYKLKSELAGNTKPVAHSYSVNVPTNGSVSLDYTAKSSEYDGDNVNFWKYTNEPANGTMSDMYNGFATYTPDPGFSGIETVNWVVYDSRMTVSDEGTITFVVGDVNTPPVANNDSYDVTSEIFALLDVINNDTDSDGTVDASTLAIVSQASNGVVTVDGTNLRYTSNNGYTGSDSFTYTVEDNEGGVSNTATVNLTVHAGDIRAIVGDDSFVFNSNSSNNSLGDALNNDSDTDATTSLLSRFTLTSLPANGSVTMIGSTPHYTPDVDFYGPDSFTYKISGEGYTPWDSLDATISITVLDSNTAPVANNDSVTTNEDTLAPISPLSNDTDDAPLNLLTLTILSQPYNGSVVKRGVNFQYTPSANYNGADSFTYKLTDSGGKESGIATVNITVNPVNDAPTTQDDNFTVGANISTTLNVLSNDSDVDHSNSSLIINLESTATNGTATIDNGSIIYTPLNGFVGSGGFSYSVTDPAGDTSNTSSVTISVTNAALPVAVSDHFVFNEDSSPTPLPVSQNDSVTGSVVNLEIIQQPQHGSININNNTATFTPTENAFGQSSFVYRFTDETGLQSNTATSSIMLINQNDAPVTHNDSLSVATGVNNQLNILTNDVDEQLNSTEIIIDNQPLFGTLTLIDNKLYYQVTDISQISDSFTYHIKDTHGLESNRSTVTLSIGSQLPLPQTQGDEFTVKVNSQKILDLIRNDTIFSDIYTLVIEQDPASGSIAQNGNEIIYTANNNNGQDTFVYRITDEEGQESTSATVIINKTLTMPLRTNDDYIDVSENDNITISVIENDEFENIDSLELHTNGTLGQVSLDEQNNVIYQSVENDDSFTYCLTDTQQDTQCAQVYINILPIDTDQNDNNDTADSTPDQSNDQLEEAQQPTRKSGGGAIFYILLLVSSLIGFKSKIKGGRHE